MTTQKEHKEPLLDDDKNEGERDKSKSLEEINVEVSGKKPVTVNQVVVISPGQSGEKSDDSEDETPSNINVEVVNLNHGDRDNDEGKENMTLLDKALLYRQENPEKWKKRQMEEETKLQESYGIYRDDPFLTNYYKRLDEIQEEGERMEELRRHEPPKLLILLEFNLPRSPLARKSSSAETYASMSANGVSVYDKDESFFDIFKKQSSEERGKEPELLITVTKGKNFNNVLGENESRLKECRLKCKLFPDSLKHGPKTKTNYVYCNTKGTTKWNHVFVLKRFSAEELAERYVLLEAVGKTNDRKVVVGRTILAGNQAILNDEHTADPKLAPTEEQSTKWHQALEKPGTSVTVNMSMTTIQNKLSKGSSMKSLFAHEMNKKSKTRAEKKNPLKKIVIK